MLKWWDKIVRYFYSRSLRDRLKEFSRLHTVINLKDAKSVGIIYDSTHPGNDSVIGEFATRLRSQGKTVEVLGFVNDKKIDSKPDVPVFNKKALTWAMVPTDEKALQFAGKNFDLLLACFTTESLPLEYISCISKARWRVGHYNPAKTDCYDMMVNMGNKTELPYFIDQATQFLNKIEYDTVKA